MHKAIIWFLLWTIILGSCVPGQSYCGRVLEPKSRASFFKYINSAQLAVVQLYSRVCNKKEAFSLCGCLKQRLIAASQNGRFSYAQIVFILMDVSCDPSVLRDIGVFYTPSLVIFSDGRPITNNEGFVAQFNGIPSEIDINQFIEATIGEQINQLTQAHAQYDQEREQAQLAAWAAWAPYWYGGCYRPCFGGWGFGCGWGGGCGWCW